MKEAVLDKDSLFFVIRYNGKIIQVNYINRVSPFFQDLTLSRSLHPFQQCSRW